jgi:hypothetical protein
MIQLRLRMNNAEMMAADCYASVAIICQTVIFVTVGQLLAALPQQQTVAALPDSER